MSQEQEPASSNVLEPEPESESLFLITSEDTDIVKTDNNITTDIDHKNTKTLQHSNNIITNSSTSKHTINPTGSITASGSTKNSISIDSIRKSDGSSSNVSFGSVHVHEHRMTLGSNPGVGRGVPVELAWDVLESNEFNTIDEYEENVRNSAQSKDHHIHHHSTTAAAAPEVTETTQLSSSQQNDNSDTLTTANTNSNNNDTDNNEASTSTNVAIDGNNTTSDAAQPSSTTPLTSHPVTVTSPTTIQQQQQPRVVKRIPASKREEIASIHHSRDSIVRVEREVKTIQQNRSNSRTDTAAKKMVQELKRQPNSIISTIQQQKQQNTSTNHDTTNTTTSKKSFWSYCCPS